MSFCTKLWENILQNLFHNSFLQTVPVSERLKHPLLRPERAVGAAGAVEVVFVLCHHDGEPRSAGDGRGADEASPQPLLVELSGYG